MTFLFILCLNVFFIKASATALCGKKMSSLVTVDPFFKTAKMDFFYSFNKDKNEFCESAKNEINANVKLRLLDADKKIIYEKLIFINKFSILETLAANNKTIGNKNKIELKPQYRNLNFSINESLDRLKFYQIISLEDDSIMGESSIILNKREASYE